MKTREHHITEGKGTKTTGSNEPFFQAKLTINNPHDVYEQEADAVAEKLMRMPENQNGRQSFFQPTITPVQRKCAHCEEEEKKKAQRKEINGDGTSANRSLENYVGSLNSSGQPLSKELRSFFEPRMGYDFSNVKIHTDSVAAKSAQSINALAYTSGNNIVFNEGQHQPESDSGKKLLAHELTHVVQQQAATPSIQREPDDKHDLTATQLSGDAILEKTFDNETTISTNRNSNGTHVKKIQQGLMQLGIALPNFGADAQYGKETANGVKEFQQQAGMTEPQEWDGIVGRKTIGLLDRSLRNNTIETDADNSENDFRVFDENKNAEDEACKGKATDKPCPNPNPDVDAAATAAMALIDKTIDQQLPPAKTDAADYPTLFATIFRNNDNRDVSQTVAEVKAIYLKVKDFIAQMKTDKSIVRCATECDGGCRSGSPAYHTNSEGKHTISFCPDFNAHEDRILIVLHECHHAAIPGSRDLAYPDTRLFEKLDHSKALLNAASFHVYAAWVETPGSATVGPEVDDTNLISDTGQKTKTDFALAHMNQWFKLVPFDTSQTVQGVEEANTTGVYPENNSEIFMERVFSPWFGLTSPPARPTNQDVQKIKAIDERVGIMENAFKTPFVIVETPDASFWESGPGSGIALNQQTLNLDLNHLIVALLQELVHATPNISAETEPLYVGTINDMRNLRRLDP